MAQLVVTTQLCPVWSAVPPRGERLGEILAGQQISIQVKETGDAFALIVGPDNLYPTYLKTGHPGYVEVAHTRLVGAPEPGQATLNGIMAAVVANTKMLEEIKAKLGL